MRRRERANVGEETEKQRLDKITFIIKQLKSIEGTRFCSQSLRSTLVHAPTKYTHTMRFLFPIPRKTRRSELRLRCTVYTAGPARPHCSPTSYGRFSRFPSLSPSRYYYIAVKGFSNVALRLGNLRSFVRCEHVRACRRDIITVRFPRNQSYQIICLKYKKNLCSFFFF